jgi:hypothetical protein
METSIIINIIAKEEGNIWVGHCLELDIVATANDLDQLKHDLVDLIIAQIDYAFSNDNLDNLFHPAPREVWEKFYKCKKQTEDRISFESESQKNSPLKTFVPPWIITKTCIAGESCFVQ